MPASPPPTPSPAAATRRPVRARAATTAVFFGCGAGYGAWAACIPAVQAGLGLSDAWLGVGLLGVAGGSILFMPAAGWLCARSGAGAVMLASGALFALTLPLPALAPSFWALVAASFLLGAANGVMDVSMNAHAAAVERDWGAAIMSSFHAGFSLGGLFGVAAGGLALGAGLGAAGCLWAAAGLVGALVAAAAGLGAGSAGAGAGGATSGEARRGFVLPGRRVLGLGALAGAVFLLEGSVADWSGVFLGRELGASPGAAVWGFAAFSATMVAGRLAGDRVVRALGGALVLRLGAGLAVAGMALALAAGTPWAAAAGFGLVGLGAANVVPVLFSRAGERGPAALAAVASMGYAGFLLGPPAIGFVAEAVGLRAALGVPLLAAAAVLVFGRVGGRPEERPGEQPEGRPTERLRAAPPA